MPTVLAFFPFYSKMCSLFEEINLPEKEFQELIEKAKDWALMHGKLLIYLFVKKK